jgi:hypothetical protein
MVVRPSQVGRRHEGDLAHVALRGELAHLHQSGPEVEKGREKQVPSKWRPQQQRAGVRHEGHNRQL